MPARPNRIKAKEVKEIADLKNLTELTENLNGEVRIVCDQETNDQASRYRNLLTKAKETANKKLQK